MNTFSLARIKLTAWYLLIIMCVGITFSFITYKSLTRELDRLQQRIQNVQYQKAQIIPFPGSVIQLQPAPPPISIAEIEDSKARIALILIVINLGILAVAGLAGYFLAGKTLEPIQNMLDEQNRFITDASHELRTPLTALKTEIEVNLRDKNLKLSEAKHLLESNLEEVDNLQMLSDNLLTLVQYEAGNKSHIFSPTSVTKCVHYAIKKVTPIAYDKHVSLQNECQQDIFILGDTSRITELFVILLENAVKYSSENTTAVVSAKISDNTVSIEVSDQGMGIDEKDIPHIFDRFYRADKSRTKNEAAGYGLGLAIAKQIVTQHKGLITVKSKPGEGTLFTVKLPLQSGIKTV